MTTPTLKKVFIPICAISILVSVGTALAQPPVADFTADTTSGCATLIINFTDISTPGGAPIATWLWNFGDGNTDTVQNPTNAYINPGTYTVSLVVTDTLGVSDSLVKPAYITVIAVPSTAGPITGPTTPCIGSTQTYSISPVSGATSYNWTVPAGWTINSGQGTSSINVTVGSSSGNICVQACNNCGCSSLQCKMVTANTIPNQPDSIFGPTNPNVGSTQIYSIVYVGPATSFFWTVPIGWTITSGQGSISITVTVGSSSGNVMVRACNNCGCSSFYNIPVVSCSLAMSLGNDTAFCLGNTLILDAGNPGASYLWQDSSATQTFNVAATGQYYVQVTDTNGCQNSDTINIWVDSVFNATIGPSGPFCISDAPLNLTATDSGGLWAGNGITNANTGTFSPATAGAGTHQITYTISGVCGDVDTVLITVNPTYNISDPVIAICTGDSALIYGTYRTIAGTYYDLLTTVSGCDSVHSTILSVNPAFSISTANETVCDGDSVMIFGAYRKTAGTYYDSSITVNGCDSIIATTLIVNPLPVVSFSGLDTVYCSTNAGVTLTGTPAGGVFSGTGGIAGNQFFPATGVNTYTVIYSFTDSLGCSNSVSQSVSVIQCTGIPETGRLQQIKYTPTPLPANSP